MTNYGPIGNNVAGLQYSHPGREKKIKADLFGIKIQVGHQSTNKPMLDRRGAWTSNFTSLTLDFFHL